MNTRRLKISGYLIIALLFALAALAACAPASPAGTFPPQSNAPAQAPAAAATQAATTVPTAAATTAPAAAPTNAPSASGASTASLKVSENPSLGKFLTDSAGRTLYLFMKDTKNTSNCYDACAQKWPPLVSQNKPSLGDGVNADLVGSTQRKDGSSQVTYNGWPLYYYAPDQNPGDTKGQGVGSVWFVVTPSGDAFTGGASTGASATPTAPASAQNSAPAGSPVALQVAKNAALGTFLADGQNRTLYLFLKDTKNTSNCYDACAQKWPPLISSGQPMLGNGIDTGLLGTTTRKDGTTQVTFNGWPLYYYAPDTQPGDVKGQGVGSVWFVITPSGDTDTASVAPAAPAAPAAAPTQASSNPYKY